MKISTLPLASLWLILLAQACGLEPEPDYYEPPEEEEAAPDAGPDVEGGQEEGEFYRYVLVEDAHFAELAETLGGERVDSVALHKGSGEIFFADRLVGAAPLTARRNTELPESILGEPDATCRDESGLYALGGKGGWVIVSFGEQIIEDGDSIYVGSTYGICPGHWEHEVHVSVGRHPDYEGAPWHRIAEYFELWGYEYGVPVSLPEE